MWGKVDLHCCCRRMFCLSRIATCLHLVSCIVLQEIRRSLFPLPGSSFGCRTQLQGQRDPALLCRRMFCARKIALCLPVVCCSRNCYIHFTKSFSYCRAHILPDTTQSHNYHFHMRGFFAGFPVVQSVREGRCRNTPWVHSSQQR